MSIRPTFDSPETPRSLVEPCAAPPPAARRTFTSLVGVMRARAAAAPAARALTWLDNGEAEAGAWTRARLDQQSRAVAAAVARRVRPGDRALLLYPPGLDFVAAFFGCLSAGVIAVPAAPPQGGRAARGRQRLEAIVADATPTIALTTHEAARRGSAPGGLRWLPTDDLPLADGRQDDDEYAANPDDVAFLQYTSGSTAEPKGVMVTHANLISNLSYGAWLGGDDSRGPSVSWLPVTHDMGLIEGILQPVWSGTPVHLMSPASFLQRPARWLEAISRYAAVRSGGPNFAYDLIAKRIRPEELRRLDLSSWRAAFSGAEPVRPDTMARFARTFAPAGFTASALRPCYGLAEATLVVTSGRWDRHEAGGVACGVVGGGSTTVTIVDPATGRRLPDGEIGEIWVQGPGVARGYWNKPDQSAVTFRANSPDLPGEFLRTGDLGRVDRGQLFVAGRLKDLLIVRGAKYFPQDLEQTAERVSPGLRRGSATAFAAGYGPAGDQIALVVEADPRTQAGTEAFDAILDAIRQAVVDEHGIQLHGVAVVAPGGVPKTTSGKLQRYACRALWLADDLPVFTSWRATPLVDTAADGSAS